jgi:hypothetical protein
MCKILIEIEGGEVSKVTTNKQMEVIVVTRRPCLAPNVEMVEIDTILNGGENFSKSYRDSLDEDDQVIYHSLKILKQ